MAYLKDHLKNMQIFSQEEMQKNKESFMRSDSSSSNSGHSIGGKNSDKNDEYTIDELDLQADRSISRLGQNMLQHNSQQQEFDFQNDLMFSMDPSFMIDDHGQDDRLKKGGITSQQAISRQSSSDHSQKQQYLDLIQVINKNEKVLQLSSQERLQMKSEMKQFQQNISHIKQKVLSDTTYLTRVQTQTQGYQDQNYITCIGLSDDLIFLGNAHGQLVMYDRTSEELYATFQEKSKNFEGNGITCIDIHPLRTEYVLIGYQHGEIILLDVTEPEKPIKILKDVHKKQPLVVVKFCDWHVEKSSSDANVSNSVTGNIQDKQMWMFISCCLKGRVVLNQVQKRMVYLKNFKKYIFEPQSDNDPKFFTISPRFHSVMYPMSEETDKQNFVALANEDLLQIMLISNKQPEILYELARPRKFKNTQTNKLEQLPRQSPSLAWGVGKTPTRTDRVYPILAVGWGPIIQLIVLNDIENEDQLLIIDGYYILRDIKRKLVRQWDESDEENSQRPQNTAKLFHNLDFHIEQLTFISEGIILALTANHEIRILYTQTLHKGSYSTIQHPQNNPYPTQFIQELESGTQLEALRRQSYSQNLPGAPKFLQSFTHFDGVLLALTNENSVMRMSHLSWINSLAEFKKNNQVKDNWGKLLARAIDIYHGKVKGFRGVSEHNEIRQQAMKADLKLLIHEIINDVVVKYKHSQSFDKSQTSSQNKADDSDDIEDLSEQVRMLDQAQNENLIKQRSLIRIAIEICIELDDIYFLFYDLLMLFQEDNLDEIFVEELEPFILAGKFRNNNLPYEILEKQIISHYNKFSKPYNFEKIILNLCLDSCPDQLFKQLLTYSQEYNLSSALTYLYMIKIYKDEDKEMTCIALFQQLISLYLKLQQNGKDLPKEKIFRISKLPHNSSERPILEQTATYLGYKILWILKFFFEGKKFPQEDILLPEMLWREYCLQIVDYITQKPNLFCLMKIDAQAFLEVFSMIFYGGKLYEFFEQSEYLSHTKIIDRLNTFCQSKEASEQVRLQYLFFIAQIAERSPLKQEPSFYLNTVKQLIQKAQKFIQFQNQQIFSSKQDEQPHQQLSSQDTHYQILKQCEHSMITLLELSEPIEEGDVENLLKLTLSCPFNQVKVYILEKKQDFVQCLQLYLSGMKHSIELSNEDSTIEVFRWIKDRMDLLLAKAINIELTPDECKKSEQFQRELKQNVEKLVRLSPQLTLNLLDEKFDSNYQDSYNFLKKHPKEQFALLDTILKTKEQHMQDTIKQNQLSSNNPGLSKLYLEFLTQHLKLTCQMQADSVLSIVQGIVKNEYYPLEECLEISKEFNQTESCALLNNSIGNFFEAVQLYLKVLDTEVSMPDLKKEIYFASGVEMDHDGNQVLTGSIEFNRVDRQFRNANKFDAVLTTIIRICQSNSGQVEVGKEEEIWLITLDSLFRLRSHQVMAKKKLCSQFFMKRITLFTQILIQYIPFETFLEHILKITENKLKYKYVCQIIQDSMNDKMQENTILQIATKAINKYKRCLLCRKLVDSYDDDIFMRSYIGVNTKDESSDDDILGEYDSLDYYSMTKVFSTFTCGHPFHLKCLRKHTPLLTDREKSSFSHEEKVQIAKDKQSKQRCPVCYAKNVDMPETGTHSSSAQLQKKSKANLKSKQASQQQAQASDKGQADLQQKKVSKAERIRNRETLRATLIKQKKLDRLHQKMTTFDTMLEQEAVRGKNFVF